MRFPMWYVRPAKAQTSLRIQAVWSEPLLVSWWFHEHLATDWTSFGVSKLKRRLHKLVWVFACQNATFLEITCRGSIMTKLHSNHLPADDSCEIASLIFMKMKENNQKIVACCSHALRFKRILGIFLHICFGPGTRAVSEKELDKPAFVSCDLGFLCWYLSIGPKVGYRSIGACKLL